MPRTWKDETVWGDLQPIAQKGYGRVKQLFYDHALDFYVTSIRDGHHKSGSLHRIGLAFDCGKGPFKKADILAALNGDYWQVIDESNHWHCEWDEVQGR